MPTSADALLGQALAATAGGPAVSLSDPVEWAQALAWATHHHLLPIVAAALPRDTLPAAVAERLAHAARSQRLRTAVMAEALQRILEGCARAGIAAAPLKGMALAHTVYPSPTLRYCDDIDLLIEPGRAAEALAVLHELGYRPHPRVPRPDWHHLPPQTHPQHGVTVELHSDLVRRSRLGWPLAAVWERTTAGTLVGAPCRRLQPVDLLVHTALHARHHLFDRPTFLLDAALLLPHCDPAELSAQIEAAGARCAAAHLWEGLRIWGFPGVRPPKACPAGRRRAARRVRPWETFAPPDGRRRVGAAAHLIELGLTDSWGDGARLAWALLRPSAEFTRAGYGSPGRRLLDRLLSLARQVG